MSAFVALQYLVPLALGILGLVVPAAGGVPAESQAPATELITARWVFNGTDGSFYNGTQAGPQGAELGFVFRNFTLGRGWWGQDAIFDRIRMAYPGNLTLAPSLSANEVFYARAAAGPRDRNATGVTQWTAGTPTNSIHVISFDQDGDGWLDDAVLAFTGAINRVYTYNQAGTQIGFRSINPNVQLNDVAAVDTDSNGVLDQIAVAHGGGWVFVERPAVTDIWGYSVPGLEAVNVTLGADFNNDSFLDNVVAGTADGAVYALNGTGVLKWAYSTGTGVQAVNLSAMATPGAHWLNGILVGAPDAVTLVGWAGQVIWNWTANVTVTGAIAYDRDRDGIPESAAFADDTGAVTLLDENGTVSAWSDPLEGPVESLDAIDLDGDGWLNELVVANDTVVVGLDANASELWRYTVGAGFTINMVAHGDFDGNGFYGDTIVPSSDTLYVLNRTGGLRWSVSEARNLPSAAFIENPSAAANGSYTSPPLDAGIDATWGNLTWAAAVSGPTETLAGAVRFGQGTPGNIVWGNWSTPSATGPVDLVGNVSRFVQVRFDFTSTDGVNSAALGSFRVNFSSPALTGTVETDTLAPPSGPAWLDFGALDNPSGGAIRYYYSANGGASWHPILPGEPIDASNASVPSLRVRIEMDTGAVSPTVSWVSLRYAQPGLRPAIASPAANATITGVYNVTAVADPSIVALSLSSVNLSTNATVLMGAGSFDAGSGRWWRLWNTSALDGPGFALVATATDARGFNFTGARLPLSVDNQVPVVTIQQPAVNAVLTGTSTLRASASPDTASLLFSYFDGVSINPIGAALETSPGIWELDWDTSSVSELEGVRVYASATDGVGLTGSAQQFPVVVDNRPPDLNVTAPAVGSELTGLVNVSVSGSLDLLGVEIVFNGSSAGNATALPPTLNESRWIVAWDTSPVYFSASVNLSVVGRDRAGHLTTFVAGPFVINNTQPVPDLVAPLVGSYNTGAVFVVASAPPGTASIEFSYKDRSAALPTLIRTMAASERNLTSGLWEFSWDTAQPRVDFNGSIILKATSDFGISGTRSFSWVVVDNTAPSVSFVAPRVGETRLSGLFVIDVQTTSDVTGVEFSYTNVTSGAEIPVGPLVPLSPFEWGTTWDLTNLFVPSATLHLVAVDHVGLRGWANFSFVVIGIKPGDSPPTIVRNPSDISLDEDFGTFSLDLAGLVTDDDSSNVTAYVDGIDSRVVTLRNNGSKGLLPLYFVSLPNAHSAVQSQLMLRVVDASGQTDSRPFGFFVAPRNDAPYWSAPPEVPPPQRIVVHYDAPYELDFAAYAHDVEFEHENGPLFVSPDVATFIVQNASRTTSLIFTYPQALLGQTLFVNLTLSDGDSAIVALPIIQIAVFVSDDWAPELTRPIPIIYLFEDTPQSNVVDLADYFSDRDNEALYYYRGNTNISFEISGGNVSVTAMPLDWSGTQSVFFGANDSHHAFSEARVTFVVQPVDDPPVWDFSSGLVISTFYVHFDETFAFDFSPYVIDVDTPASGLRLLTTDPGHASAVPGKPLVLAITYPESANGTTRVFSLWINDGSQNSSSIGFNVSVSANYPPALVQPLPLEVVILEGDDPVNVLNLTDYFIDPDGVLFFYNGTVHVKVTITPEGKLFLSSPDEWGGTETLIIRAVDNDLSFQQATLLVTVLPVDDPPTLRYIGDITVVSGARPAEVALVDFANDTDTPQDQLVFSARSSYKSVYLSISGGMLTAFYPQYDGANDFDTIIVCVSDGNAKDCQSIGVTVVQPLERPFDWFGLIFVMSTSAAGAIIAARHFVEFKIKRSPTVEDIFLVYEDGILIKHYSKKMRKFADDDVVTSMLSAIQSFAADSFEDKSNWELREITFQGRRILIEKARKFQIYIIFDGDSNEDLKHAIKRAADSIAREYEEPLKDWDGDPSHFDSAEKNFAELLRMEAAFIPTDIRGDELKRAPLVPGNFYMSETGNFDPILKLYAAELKGTPVVRVRPAPDAGSSLSALNPKEVETIEVPAPKGVPGDEESGETALDVAARAVKTAIGEAKRAVPGRAPAIFFEGFGFIVDRYGFVFSKKFADQLKRIASAEGCYLFVAVEPKELDPAQMEGLERDAVVLRGG